MNPPMTARILRRPSLKRTAAAVGLSAFLVIGASSALAAEENGENPATGETVLTLIAKGGKIMYPLGLCSVIALAIGIERFVSLRRNRLVPPGFVAGLRSAWDGRPNTRGDGVRYCEAHESPTARMLIPGIKNMPRSPETVEKAIEDAGVREADRLHRSLRSLSVIAAISPLLGLLGTVYGLIGAFQEATAKDLGKGQELAKGIYEALVTTAAGLTIAIPVLLAYQFLRVRADKAIDAMGGVAEEFSEHYLADQEIKEAAA